MREHLATRSSKGLHPLTLCCVDSLLTHSNNPWTLGSKPLKGLRYLTLREQLSYILKQCVNIWEPGLEGVTPSKVAWTPIMSEHLETKPLRCYTLQCCVNSWVTSSRIAWTFGNQVLRAYHPLKLREPPTMSEHLETKPWRGYTL